MDILIKTSVLRDALQNVIAVIDKSLAKPILSNFLIKTLEAEGDETQAEFTATDYELSLIERHSVEVREEGSICVNARKMYDIVREFSGEMVHIQSTEQLWVNVTCGSSELRLPTVEVGLYPQTEIEDLPEKLSIPVEDLKRGIDMTLFAAQTNESRRNLMGVNLTTPETGKVRWLATDGHRLAQVLSETESTSFSQVQEVIIPRKALSEVRRSVELFGDTVQVSFDDRVMQFMGNDLAYKTRLIEGKFPNCDPIIPKDNTLVATVDRERLVSSLKIVSSISTEKLRPVKLTLSSGKLRVESEKAEYGEVSDELDAEYSGEDFQIGFNSRYLLDTLGVMSTAQVRMEFKNPMSPSVVREEADGSFLSVIMPLRIEW